MKPHAIGQYIAYRWKAKDLHGVHSPFAYDFNKNVLHGNKGYERKEYAWLPVKYNMLLGKLLVHYQYNDVLALPPEDDREQEDKDVLLLNAAFPGQWVSLFNKYKPLLRRNSAVVVEGIHQTKRHTAKWKRLRKHPKVRMSIDLFGVGILFFRDEFREKQHFVLKY